MKNLNRYACWGLLALLVTTAQAQPSSADFVPPPVTTPRTPKNPNPPALEKTAEPIDWAWRYNMKAAELQQAQDTIQSLNGERKLLAVVIALLAIALGVVARKNNPPKAKAGPSGAATQLALLQAQHSTLKAAHEELLARSGASDNQ